jgi:hypothetical protein
MGKAKKGLRFLAGRATLFGVLGLVLLGRVSRGKS